MSELPEIAGTIRRQRKRLGVSQEAAARAVGVQRLQWIRWEQGKYAPSGEHRRALAAYLGIPESAVTRDEEKPDALTLLIRGIVEREVERALAARVAA